MKRQLIIMRHAKSAWDTDAVSDFERPLAKRGLQDAPRMGQWLSDHGLIPDSIVSSPALRAKQTILEVCKVLDIKKKAVLWDARIYGAGTEELLEVLAELPKQTEIAMIVGHNPGLEMLFEYLVNHDMALSGLEEGGEAGAIKTATIAHLEIANDWSHLTPGCATLVNLISPRQLAE
ncbi:MAG: histidine phosphatase family protein [Magnetococcales bacterium]|nr:histidine phosphatase family protein [Magnetococcales bacterium]MBF0260915.1 histidine phosphatase family protein [Magnetococcales bacterium]